MTESEAFALIPIPGLIRGRLTVEVLHGAVGGPGSTEPRRGHRWPQKET
jgi:hypothetical protein